MKSYAVKKSDLGKWIDGLIERNEVAAPLKHGNSTDFDLIRSAKEIVWGGPQTVAPPKKYFFLQFEDILSLQPNKIEGLNASAPKTIIGIHPCDLNAVYLMDQVFAEKNRDENYLEKRKKAVLIGVDCLKPCAPESICLRMGGLDPRGRFDLFLTDIVASFFVEVGTPKGEALIREIGRESTAAEAKKLAAVRKKRDQLFNKEQKKLLPKLKELPKLMGKSQNHPEWAARGEKCYSCGSCNAVCPTCYCFDVQDYMHVNLAKGVRQRFWDGCMLDDFAKVASGENFRENRSERLRHRTYRKLHYLFEKWGESYCTGCGRCVKACLTNIVSPLEIANTLFGKGKK